MLDLSTPLVMGILNLTPDSFSDGGRYPGVESAVERAVEMREQGAAIIDLGGESTRPGSKPVSVQQELDRVIPVIEALHGRIDAVLSIDTSKPEVMSAAVKAGAGLINDVYALRRAYALDAARSAGVPVCLMHMQGEPKSMQKEPHYQDVVDELGTFFEQRIAACGAAGIDKSRLILDPGFGFGKTLEHNITLLDRLADFRRFGCPLLIGISRKSMLGRITGAPVDRRLPAGLAAATIAMLKGATIIRTHDVAATQQAVMICRALFDQQDHRNDGA